MQTEGSSSGTPREIWERQRCAPSICAKPIELLTADDLETASAEWAQKRENRKTVRGKLEIWPFRDADREAFRLSCVRLDQFDGDEGIAYSVHAGGCAANAIGVFIGTWPCGGSTVYFSDEWIEFAVDRSPRGLDFGFVRVRITGIVSSVLDKANWMLRIQPMRVESSPDSLMDTRAYMARHFNPFGPLGASPPCLCLHAHATSCSCSCHVLHNYRRRAQM